MADSAKSEKTSKLVKFWNGVKAEFKKIVWPDKEDLLKQSVAVVIISVVGRQEGVYTCRGWWWSKHLKIPIKSRF